MFGAVSTLTGSIGRFTRLKNLCQLQMVKGGCFIHTGAALSVRFRDIVPEPVVPAGSQDILLQNVRSAKDSNAVLNAVSRHHSIMNSKHVVQALKSLFLLQKAQSSQISNGQVINSKDFRKLCEVLKSQIRHLELNDLIEVLKCMGYLGVPADTKVMNILLGILSKQVNDLTLQQITFLDFVMKDFKSTPLVKALKIALPIVFEANLQTKCDFDNVSQLSELLSFVSKRKNMERSTQLLVNALNNRRDQLSLKEATNIVYALCDNKFYSGNFQTLFCYTLDIITDSLDSMDFYEMESILSRLYWKHSDSNGNTSYYHEGYCNGCAHMVIKKDYSFEHTLWILKKLIKFDCD
ncbi:hypothetical protein J6590_054972 [Homalodisca vitripennis]|nr:hypothetical protein J6590_054972 [Homalodisca vitripennis]